MSNSLGSYPGSGSAPDHPTLMNCVYPISGTYGFLPRILYYITLVFAIFGRRQEWLVIGALVSALTYAGTSAIHQMALVGSKHPIYDLDIIAAWAVLSTGALAYISMMHWSSTLRDSRARGVLMAWGVLVGVGLILGRVELFDQPLAEAEPACYSRDGTRLLVYPIETVGGLFNCSYKCFEGTKPMRQPWEVMAVPREVLKNRWTGFTKVLVGPIQFAAYAALSFDSSGHTPSEHCMRIVMKYLNPQHHEDMVKSIYCASQETTYGGYILLWHYAVHRSTSGRQKVLILAIAMPWFALGLLVDLLALPLMVVNIVLNELTMMTTQLPTNEANYAIGQWGPWVSSVLVVIAAIVKKVLELQDRSKEAKWRRMEEEAEATGDNLPSSCELGPVDVKEQTMGVVKPPLAHVPTLPDMEMAVERPKG